MMTQRNYSIRLFFFFASEFKLNTVRVPTVLNEATAEETLEQWEVEELDSLNDV